MKHGCREALIHIQNQLLAYIILTRTDVTEADKEDISRHEVWHDIKERCLVLLTISAQSEIDPCACAW